jgi:hypothetical protein
MGASQVLMLQLMSHLMDAKGRFTVVTGDSSHDVGYRRLLSVCIECVIDCECSTWSTAYFVLCNSMLQGGCSL